MKITKEYINEDGTPFSREQFINKIKTDDEFAEKLGDLGPIYGKQWRSWETITKKWWDEPENNGYGADTRSGWNYEETQIDQIQNLINNLKTNPDSRRLMVSAWDVGSLDQMVLPPCHYGFQVYTRELSLEERATIWNNTHNPVGNIYTHNQYDENDIPTRAISLMFNMRSNDVPLGLPFNIASYGLLLEIIGKMVNMIPDELIINIGDAHIYINQIEGVKKQISREPFPLPKLNISTEWWPTESGECGVGPIDTQAVLEGLSDDNFCKCLMGEDIQLINYKHHPTIKMPLSN